MKVGDKVNVIDTSWSFGVCGGKFNNYMPSGYTKGLTIIKAGLSVMERADGDRTGCCPEICDLLVTDGDGNFWFAPSRLCEPVDKKIEVKYFCNGEDVTDSISEETARSLHCIRRG